MSSLNTESLSKIEKALDIKFYDWQVEYLLNTSSTLDIQATGRRSGKTLVHIIKLLFSDDKPIRAYKVKEVQRYSDWYSVSNELYNISSYTKWFKKYLQDIYKKLLKGGLQPRPVFFSIKEEEQFYG